MRYQITITPNKPFSMNKKLLFTIPLITLLPMQIRAQQTDSLSTDTIVRQLGEATATTTRLVFTNKKDTVVYDMNALLATQGDMLNDVINKMPGLELRDGVLYFKGKKVERLMVNGTDFMRNDTKTALEQLPAYMVKTVKAYESLTDQAKVTGIDDGQREQVVNVELRKNYLNTWTGNVDLGYATDDYYRLRGFANTFNALSRISLYSGLTNTGEYQSTDNSGGWEDNGSGSSPGKTSYKRPGATFMFKNREEEEGKGFVKIDGHATWDYRKHNDRSRENKQYFLDEGSRYEASNGHDRNCEEITAARISLTWKPTVTTHLEFRPWFSHTSTRGRKAQATGQWNANVFSLANDPIGLLRQSGAEGWPAGEAVTLWQAETASTLSSNAYYHTFFLTQRLTENNWRISINHLLNDQHNDTQAHALNGYRYFQPSATPQPTLLNRYNEKESSVREQQVSADLNIPLPVLQTLRLSYSFANSRRQSDAQGFLLDRMGGVFADYDSYLAHYGTLPTEEDWRMLAREAETTVNSLKKTHRHKAEGYLQYKSKHLYASVRSTWNFCYDFMDYRKGDYEPQILSRHATDYSLFAQLRYETDSMGNFDLQYSYSTQPQQLDLQINIPDLSDPLHVQLAAGHLPRLEQQSVGIFYTGNLKNGKMFSIDLNWNQWLGHTVSRSTYDPVTGITTTRLTTVNGRWNGTARVYFGMPLDKQQQFNWSVSVLYDYMHEPNFAQTTAGEPFRYTNHQHLLYTKTTLQARTGQFFGTFNYYNVFIRQRSPLASATSTGKTSHHFLTSLQYTFPGDWEIKSSVEANYQYALASANYTPWRTIWTASVAKRLLPGKQLTLKLEASDILNQRSRSYAWARAEYTSNNWYNCVQRFVMFHVIYHFNTKKK